MFTSTDFTPELRAEMGPYAQAWIEWALNTSPVSVEDRARVEDGIRRCYELSGLSWHGRVVWVSSPIVGACAAPIANATIRDATIGTIRDTIAGTIAGTVAGTVLDTIADTVRDTIADTILDTIAGTIDGTVRGTIAGTIAGTVRGTTRSTVAAITHAAIDAELIHTHKQTISKQWAHYISGWWSWWQARSGFCIDILGVATEMQPRLNAWRDASSAGMWWPHQDFTIVTERPTHIHHERIGPDGWGSHELHNPHGPALKWADGWSIWCWHGIRVPQWVIETPTVERIQTEPNTEIRRCAIESLGWENYLDHIDATLVHTADDPANPGRRLELFDVPPEHQPYDEPTRVLVMTNASRDRDGSLRRFAETVPAQLGDAVVAAAWQFGTHPDIYRQLARAT